MTISTVGDLMEFLKKFDPETRIVKGYPDKTGYLDVAPVANITCTLYRVGEFDDGSGLYVDFTGSAKFPSFEAVVL